MYMDFFKSDSKFIWREVIHGLRTLFFYLDFLIIFFLSPTFLLVLLFCIFAVLGNVGYFGLLAPSVIPFLGELS